MISGHSAYSRRLLTFSAVRLGAYSDKNMVCGGP